MAARVVKLRSAKTLAGPAISIRVRSGSGFLNGSTKVVKTDIGASNGTIRVINRCFCRPHADAALDHGARGTQRASRPIELPTPGVLVGRRATHRSRWGDSVSAASTTPSSSGRILDPPHGRPRIRHRRARANAPAPASRTASGREGRSRRSASTAPQQQTGAAGASGRGADDIAGARHRIRPRDRSSRQPLNSRSPLFSGRPRSLYPWETQRCRDSGSRSSPLTQRET